jgi:predicted nucleic acid-binding protein
MVIFINDTNILIDLAELDLLTEFSKIDAELCTCDLVIAELEDAEQKEKIQSLIDTGVLKVLELSGEELFLQVAPMVDDTTGLSLEDCSVWYLAQKHKGILLSGDGRLRKQATKEGIDVKGIIYVFDELVGQGIITEQKASEKLMQLKDYNPRLPQKELDSRIKKWS